MSDRPSTPGARPYASYRVRRARYDQIYVSPHMDDAIYSCGGQIALARAQGVHVLVVTLFGDGAGAARGRGVFGDHAQRLREERAAMERLDLDHLWLDFPDVLIRPKRLRELARYALPNLPLAPSELHARLYAALEALCVRLLALEGHVFFPLAIGFHPDHRLAFEVGRALQAATALPISFYEDVPYAHVDALRAERLRQLGLVETAGLVQTAGRALLPAAREIHAFAFAQATPWQRRLAAPVVCAHLAIMRALARLSRRAAAPAGELVEREIDAAVELKVAAMRDYETQTAFFFPAGDAIYDALVRVGGAFVERTWRLPPAAGTPPRFANDFHAERARANVDALLRELARPPA